MSDKDYLEIVNKIFKSVFDHVVDFSLEDVLEKYAFDKKLPKMVRDNTTNEITWADAVNSGKYITNENMAKRDREEGWMLEKVEVTSLEDIINIWNTINMTTTERVYDSVNVVKSDTIYGCENVYRSTDSSECKNIIYCDSVSSSEYLLASSRSTRCNYSIRCDDSNTVSNSYNVICSKKISNSFFIEDSFDLYECMFCSHISSKKYCIANMQFEKDEYFEIKKEVINWILNS